jgi:hypothetical protein
MEEVKMMLSHDKLMEREKLGEDATNNTGDQVVNRFRGRKMRSGEISSLIKCSAIFIYTYSSSHNIQLLTI